MGDTISSEVGADGQNIATGKDLNQYVSTININAASETKREDRRLSRDEINDAAWDEVVAKLNYLFDAIEGSLPHRWADKRAGGIRQENKALKEFVEREIGELKRLVSQLITERESRRNVSIGEREYWAAIAIVAIFVVLVFFLVFYGRV